MSAFVSYSPDSVGSGMCLMLRDRLDENVDFFELGPQSGGNVEIVLRAARFGFDFEDYHALRFRHLC